MLLNYFKIAIAVLRRRKFFTFISLFGISFTLTIIIVLASFLNHLFSPSYPDTNRDRELYILDIKMSSENGEFYQGQMSYHYFDRYISTLKTPSKIAMSAEPKATNAYVSGKKIVVNVKYTNDQFWEVFTYDFVEGKPYNKQQIQSGEKVIVISEDTRLSYFGEEQQVVGKYMETDNVPYRVIGVVKNVPRTLRYNFADAYLPYTEAKINLQGRAYDGIFYATLLADTKEDLAAIKDEYEQVVSKVPMKGNYYDRIQSYADTYLTIFTRQSVAGDGEGDSGVVKTFTIAGILFFLFLLLPTLNLVNINISRITERSSEIGVRKAFGASSQVLVVQFMIENLIITFIGGIIGVLLAYLIITIFNNSNIVDNLHLSIDFSVLLFSIIACFVFGLLSGVYPAWRMSKLDVVTSLKAS